MLTKSEYGECNSDLPLEMFYCICENSFATFPTACTHYNTAYELQDKLFGGTPAGAGEFPHMAALFTQHRRSDDTQFSCGGTIISNRFILTAAHCLNDGEMKYARVGEVRMLLSWKQHSRMTWITNFADRHFAKPSAIRKPRLQHHANIRASWLQ